MPKTLKELAGLKTSVERLNKSDLNCLNGGDSKAVSGGTSPTGTGPGVPVACLCVCRVPEDPEPITPHGNQYEDCTPYTSSTGVYEPKGVEPNG